MLVSVAKGNGEIGQAFDDDPSTLARHLRHICRLAQGCASAGRRCNILFTISFGGSHEAVAHERRRTPVCAVGGAQSRSDLGRAAPRAAGSRGLVLEVASGSGEHTAHFARLAGPQIVFQPSDPDAQARASIDAWAATSGLIEHSPGIGARRCRRRLADRARRRRRVHQHDPHRAVGLDRRARARRRARAAAGRAAVPLWPVQARRPPHGAEQRGLRCGPAPPQPRMGRARPRSRRRPRKPPPASRRRSSPRCPPTISASSSAAAPDALTKTTGSSPAAHRQCSVIGVFQREQSTAADGVNVPASRPALPARRNFERSH